MRHIIIWAVLLMFITGCSSKTQMKIQHKENEVAIVHTAIGNPTANEVLTKYKQTDIFLMNGIVYVIAEEIDWVKDLDLTINKEVMEITSQSINGEDFIEGTASTLPIGTKIYKPLEKGDIYIAVVNGKEIRYLGWREG